MPLDADPDRISRYVIEGLIARGGMGRVYLARDPNTSRLVVVKLLDATLDSSDARDRFAREARALASLSHPNIVQIYDYGDFEESPFIVMEYVRGETLEEKIKRRAPLPVQEKLRLMSELCAGLAHAHAHESGIIHRDVKPANLMVDEHERLKILDFGIARVADSSLTRARTLDGWTQVQIGTAGYMSPEQTQGGDVDRRSDIFSVGAVAYELFGSREAFPGSTPKEIESRVMQTPPEPLAIGRPELDPEIDEILARALAKDPEDRFQNASTLGAAFDRCRSRLEGTAVPPPARRPTPATAVSSRDRARPSTATRGVPRLVPAAAAGSSWPPASDESGGRAVPEATSIDPTVLIERASHPAEPDAIDPTVVIRREDQPPRPPPAERSTPTPPRRRPTPPVSEPTVVIAPRNRPAPRPSKPAAAEAPLAALWLRLKALGGGGRRSSRQPPPKGGAKGGSGRLGNPMLKGALIAVGAVAVAVLAVFAAIRVADRGPQLTQALTLEKPAGGTITAPGLRCGSGGSDCSAEFSPGEVVELDAAADTNYVFTGFTGDCAATGRLAMTQPRSCGATFRYVAPTAAITWPLTIEKPTGGNVVDVDILCGSLESRCSQQVPDGTVVSLRYQEDDGWKFLHFTGDCSPEGQTTMSMARNCGATFVKTAPDTATGSSRPPPNVPPRPNRDPILGDPRSPVAPGVSSAPGSVASGAAPAASAPQPSASAPQPGSPASGGTPTGVQPSPTGPVNPNQKPAAPPISMEQHARNEIAKLVNSYCAALETRQAARVKELFPLQDERALARAFKEYASLKCTATPPVYEAFDPSEAGGAQVKFDMKQVIQMKSGGAPKTVETVVTMRVSRPDVRSPFLIDRIRPEPKPKD